MKQCYRCKQFKNLTDFGSDRAKKDGKSTYCLQCARQRDAEYYIRHRKSRFSQYTINKKNATKRNYSNIFSYLKLHPCVDCGEKDVLVLEFDHLNNKKNTISRMASNGYSWGTILNEIKKCEVRCSNCHARRTAKQQNWFKYMVINGGVV